MFHFIKQSIGRSDNYFSAERSSLATKWIVILSLASTILFLLVMNMDVNVYDESVILQGAVEVGEARIPHRDFFFTYGPMQLWVVSALFSAFGKTVIVARLYDIAVRGAIVLVCGLAARRLGLRASLVVGVMLIETILIAASGFYLYPVFPSILCALAGTLLLIDNRGEVEVRTRRLLGAGIITGLIAWIRYDIGFLVLAAHVISLGLFCFDARRSMRFLAGQIVTYDLGVAIIFIPVAIGAWAAGAIPGFVHDIVTFPPANYARMRGLPWPMPNSSVYSLLPLIFYTPFLAVALGAPWLFRSLTRRQGAAGAAVGKKFAIALFLLVALFILKGVVRAQPTHALLALIPAIPFLFFLASRASARLIRTLSLAVLGSSALLICADALTIIRAEAGRGFHHLFAARMAGSIPEAIRNVRCAGLPALGLGIVDKNTYQAACYIASHTRPDEPIYVGAGRHDKVFIGNVALYFVTNRRPATHWYHLEPGLQTTPEIQRRIVEDLKRSKVRLVALDTGYDDVMEPNDSARSTGVHILDRFLAAHYGEVARFGDTVILMRRSGKRS